MLKINNIYRGCKAASSAAHKEGPRSGLQLFRHRYSFSETVNGSAGVSSQYRDFYKGCPSARTYIWPSGEITMLHFVVDVYQDMRYCNMDPHPRRS